MGRIAIATLQSGWDCRWAVDEPRQLFDGGTKDSVTCTRDGEPHQVQLSTCETCAQWELRDADRSPGLQTRRASATAVAAPALAHAARARQARFLVYLLTWALVVASAASLVAMGLVILSTPLAIPVTVLLFLSAAAVIGFACAGGLPRD